MRDLTEEEKAKIQAMQKPSEMAYDDPQLIMIWMLNQWDGNLVNKHQIKNELFLNHINPAQERKRQYAAMRRAIYREAKPELVAKFSLATDKERLLDIIWHLNAISFMWYEFGMILPYMFAPTTQVSNVESLGAKPRCGRDRDRRKVCDVCANSAHRPLHDCQGPIMAKNMKQWILTFQPPTQC